MLTMFAFFQLMFFKMFGFHGWGGRCSECSSYGPKGVPKTGGSKKATKKDLLAILRVIVFFSLLLIISILLYLLSRRGHTVNSSHTCSAPFALAARGW